MIATGYTIYKSCSRLLSICFDKVQIYFRIAKHGESLRMRAMANAKFEISKRVGGFLVFLVKVEERLLVQSWSEVGEAKM